MARLATPRHVREVGTPDAEGGGRVSIMKVRGRGRPFVANMTSDELFGERERAQEAARRAARVRERETQRSISSYDFFLSLFHLSGFSRQKQLLKWGYTLKEQGHSKMIIHHLRG